MVTSRADPRIHGSVTATPRRSLRLARGGDRAYRRPPPGRKALANPDQQRIAEGVLSWDTAGETLVVVHTAPGEANRVAVAMDRLAWPEVVGTIAGDDTIFVAVKDQGAQRRVTRAIRGLRAK